MNFQEIFNKWNIKCDASTVITLWNESHRHYHNLDHLIDLVNQINDNKSDFSEKEYEMLLLTSIFHDCIYNPSSESNEEDSAKFFMECCVDKTSPDILKIRDMILETKTHSATDKLSKLFCSFDMDIINRNFEELSKWEKGISDEFIPAYGVDKYKDGRLKFLESILDSHLDNTENLLKLIDLVKSY